MIQSLIRELSAENLTEGKLKALGIIKYLVEHADISQYTLMNKQKLDIFLLQNYEHYRAHNQRTYKYKNGAW